MNERILRVLEFDKIITSLNNHVETALGSELVLQLRPNTNISEVQKKQQETDEAAQIIRLNKTIPLGGIYDIRESLKRSDIGGVLSAKECLDVANTVYGGRQAKVFLEKLEENIPLLKELADRITPLRDLEQQISMCIDEHGHIVDNASQKLGGIRSSIRTFENRVRMRLDHVIKNRSNLLSDTIVTIRNNRYVLPVKHEHRSSIGGIVHDESASGQTLFMEPQAVVDLNNQLQEAKAKEKKEMDRILRNLSEQIADHKLYLYENTVALGEIDFIYARAKLANEMNATMPKVNNNGYIKLQQARHPLIPADEVVANDIEIGKTYTTIVITGPNTGGKTVVLKMVGLCTLMAQSGLHIPAFDGCEIAVFDEVFADIGDEQSIEQNLSTFSSHMTNIVNIMEQVNDTSLVLFDELGAGTDPQEGAALAMSILDEVVFRDARVIATTHYPELKAYGYNKEKVVNASVEFNHKTLQPTYRLLLGTPGRSNAFDISKRLGLKEEIIEQAKGHLGIDSKRVENMILALEESKISAERDYKKAHHILLESEQLRKEIESEWKQLDNKREELYKKAEDKAEKALQNARREAESIVADIRKMKTDITFKEHEWIEAKKVLEEANPNLTAKKDSPNSIAIQEQDIRVGDEVKLTTFNQVGTVLEKVNNNECIIQIGNMRINAKKTNLQLVEEKKETEKKPVPMVRGSHDHVSTELDLRGERYDDALFSLEKYVDESLLAGHQKVLIIHGKGTGALRKGVQKFAETHPSITTYRDGNQNEGGNGVTVMEFK